MVNAMRSEPILRVVEEVPRTLSRGGGGSGVSGNGPPSWVHPEWEELFPWLVQGTTGRSFDGGSSDFALFREAHPPASQEVWFELMGAVGFSMAAHSRQIHGRDLHLHSLASPGLTLGDPADGHFTTQGGLLLAVTVADCVPVFLVDRKTRSVALLHAGWRGIGEGILEEGVGRLGEAFAAKARDLFLHLGPSICGGCYEVGPEVHGALDLAVPGKAKPVDLRGVLGRKALGLGLRPDRITRSAFCTLCGGSPFFSHRGGDPERQVGYLGIRPGIVLG